MAQTRKLFIGGDLSGIQKYIYSITSKKAVVSLKGRSAWLGKFMHGVYDELKEQLTKTGANPEDVYCSGGKFYIIASDNEQTRDIVHKIKIDCEDTLWRDHYGQVALAIEYVPFNDAENEKIELEDKLTDFSDLFSAISKRFTEAKNHKFRHIIENNYSRMFEVQNEGGENVRVCAVTGIEGATKQSPNEDDRYIVEEVNEQIELGKLLRGMDKITKTFDQYAKPYIAVLRMDVDGLGAKFRKIKTKKEYKKFSKRLDDFFISEIDWSGIQPKYKTKSTLYNIWEKKYRDDSAIIYAGGDDIFVVGQWDKVIDFARNIQFEFTNEFDNDGITLSGGVAIVGGKFPIAKAAELAAEAEEAAKAYVHPQSGQAKNAFTMFGQTISWDEEFEIVEKYKEQFCQKYSESDIPTSVLHRIILLNEKRKAGIDKEGIQHDFSYYWHTIYFFTRLKERHNDDLTTFLNKLLKELLNNERNFDLIALAARWAELGIRKNNNN